ncbi:MAG: tetratricopeptide repeat protein [Gammaproteobacteria bacterium]|nr:tetratricopeptide repeat protein [Gammaproteobacteria bacterium]
MFFSLKNFLFTLWFGLLLALFGCASGPQIQPTEEVDQAHASEDDILTVDPLPNVELTPNVLYDILLGEIAGQQGQLDEAVDSLHRAARATRDPRLAARATRAAIYSKKLDHALDTANLWVELSPDNIEARETLAKVLLDLEKPVEAQLHFEKALLLAKQRNMLGAVFLRTASVLSSQSNRKTAFEVMETLVSSHPENPEAYLALAHLGVRAGDHDKALAAVGKALTIKPDWQDAALYKARILIGKGADQANAFYDTFLGRFPRATKVRLNYARFLVDQKKWDEARKQFKRVIKESPSDADAVLAVGLLSLQVGSYADAETYLLRHLQLEPDNDQARLYLGQVAEEQKNHVAAEKWYRQISSDNYYFEAQTRLAVVMARRGKLEAARKLLHSQQTNNDQQQAQLVLVEDQILREAKQYAESMKILTAALVSLEEHTEILYARALIAEKLDDLEMMERDLRVILKKEPKNAHALNALGYSLADRTDRLEEAEALVAQALALRPDDAFVLDSMGWVQYRMGNYDEAERLLRRALSIRNDAEIAAHLGEVLWVAGQQSQARTIWRRALEETPDNEMLEAVMKKFGQ